MEEDRLMEIKLNRYDQKEKLSWSVSPEGKCFDKDYTLSRNADVYEDNPIIDDEKCEPRRENFSNYQRYDSSYCFLPKNVFFKYSLFIYLNLAYCTYLVVFFCF